MTWYNQHHSKDKTLQHWAASMSLHTGYSPLLWLKYQSFWRYPFPELFKHGVKNNWVSSSGGLSKPQPWTRITTDYFWQLKLHIRLSKQFWMLVWRDQRKRPLCKTVLLSSAPVFSHMLLSALPVLTLQSSTTQPCWIPHGSSLLF